MHHIVALTAKHTQVVRGAINQVPILNVVNIITKVWRVAKFAFGLTINQLLSPQRPPFRRLNILLVGDKHG